MNVKKPVKRVKESEPVDNGRTRQVGLRKAITVNLGNYESCRIEAWEERTVNDNDKSADKAMKEITERVDNFLNEQVEELEEDEDEED